MNDYDITFSALGKKQTWLFYAKNEREAADKLLSLLDATMGLKSYNVIVHEVKRRPSWICTARKRVLEYFCG